MKRLFAILALVGAVGLASPAWSEEATTVAASEPATVQVEMAATEAVASAEAAAPAAAAPEVTVDKGDNTFIMIAAALVMLMTVPGLALFYGGLVRTKNMLSVLTQVFMVFCLATILWVIYGYSLAFTEGNAFFGSLDKTFLAGITPDSIAATFSKGVGISEYIYVAFQGAFAAITCALILGAFAERVRFSAILVFIVVWFTFSYIPMAHMVWYWAGPDAYTDAAAADAANATAGWLFQHGALDFAGGTVVHINSAVAGLVGAYFVGKRVGFGRESMAPHSLTMTMTGACLLWIGWFGFNAGSSLEANGVAALAFVNTWVATAVAAFTWMLAEWGMKGKPSLLGAVSGAVAGMVAITPACGFVGVAGAMAIGALAGVVCLWGVHGLKRLLNVDDSLDVFGIHGVGGMLGAILTGVFASPDLGGSGLWDYVSNAAVADYSIADQVKIQAIGVVTTLVWSGLVATVTFFLVDKLIGLRVPVEAEREGLDLTSHGERAYNY